MAGATATEDATVTELKGMPKNPARDPKKLPRDGKGSIGDKAFMDAVIIVAIAWAILLFLAFSLRHHNI